MRSYIKCYKKRLEQSKALLFVSSNNSLNSVWCKLKLNYFLSLEREIYVIDKQDIDKNIYNIKILDSHFFIDPNYEKQTLFEGKKMSIH